MYIHTSDIPLDGFLLRIYCNSLYVCDSIKAAWCHDFFTLCTEKADSGYAILKYSPKNRKTSEVFVRRQWYAVTNFAATHVR